jgi:hypothetical protein
MKIIRDDDDGDDDNVNLSQISSLLLMCHKTYHKSTRGTWEKIHSKTNRDENTLEKR